MVSMYAAAYLLQGCPYKQQSKQTANERQPSSWSVYPAKGFSQNYKQTW